MSDPGDPFPSAAGRTDGDEPPPESLAASVAAHVRTAEAFQPPALEWDEPALALRAALREAARP